MDLAYNVIILCALLVQVLVLLVIQIVKLSVKNVQAIVFVHLVLMDFIWIAINFVPPVTTLCVQLVLLALQLVAFLVILIAKYAI